MDRKWKVAIIGCGGIANSKHMPGMAKQSHRAEMVAFCDLVRERAEKAAKEYGVPGAKVYTNYKELLCDDTIDLVHVCTPNRMHSEITVAALDAGKNVICEKPMAINSAEAQKMLDAQKRSGKLLTIGYQYRRSGHNSAMKAVVDTGALGDIYFAKAHALRRRRVPNWGVFLNKYEQGGGPLIDCGTHALDLTLWMMNNYKPKYVLGQTFNYLGMGLTPDQQGHEMGGGGWDQNNFEVEDAAFGLIKMENGATIYLESSWAINMTEIKEGVTTLCGTRAGITAKPTGGFMTYDIELNNVIAGRLSESMIHVPSNPRRPGPGAGDLEAENLLDALEGKAELIVKPEQAFVVTQILEAIYVSAQRGSAVEF